MSAREKAAAAALGAAGALAGCLGGAAAIDQNTRNDLAEAAASIVAAIPLGALVPFRFWGARRLPPEALARFVRAHYVSDGAPKFDVWTFAFTKRTGLVWLREVHRDGDARWRAGSSEDFRPTIPLSHVFRRGDS